MDFARAGEGGEVSNPYARAQARKYSRDENEPEIIKALNAVGVSTWQLADEGIPDLLCLLGKVFFLLEVKNPASAGYKATKEQEKFILLAQKNGAPAFLVNSIDEALEVVKKL